MCHKKHKFTIQNKFEQIGIRNWQRLIDLKACSIVHLLYFCTIVIIHDLIEIPLRHN